METQPFVNRGPVIAWILGAILLMVLSAFAGAHVWTCWADDVHTPAVRQPSHPPPAPNAW